MSYLFSGEAFSGDDARLFWPVAAPVLLTVLPVLFMVATLFVLIIFLSPLSLTFNNPLMPLAFLASFSLVSFLEDFDVAASLLRLAGDEEEEEASDWLLFGDFWEAGLELPEDLLLDVTNLFKLVCFVLGLGLWTSGVDDRAFLLGELFRFGVDPLLPRRDLLLLFKSFSSFCFKTFLWYK